jgi:hypothetical protein
MDESNLKIVVKYTQKGKKSGKSYDATVTEAFKEKYITVEVEGMTPLVLRWDSFMYVGEFFGHNVTCDYKVERDFKANKISGSSQPYISIERKKSGRPESKR